MIVVSAFNERACKPCFVSVDIDSEGHGVHYEFHVFDLDGMVRARDMVSAACTVPPRIVQEVIAHRLTLEHGIVIDGYELALLMD